MPLLNELVVGEEYGSKGRSELHTEGRQGRPLTQVDIYSSHDTGMTAKNASSNVVI
jgi:hypothetical protein